MNTSFTDNPASFAHAQVAARAEVLAQREAVRVCHRPDVGLTVDTYAGHLLLNDYRGQGESALEATARAFLEELHRIGRPALTATARRRPDNLSHTQGEAEAVYLVDRPPDRFAITEHRWRLEVSFTDAGFATGVFLDAYNARRLVHERAAGRDVLNLFSYTGPFSVAAAAGGAASVIEVDTSKKWLAWAQRNQQLNAVATVRQRRNDAVSFLQRQADASFDLIICDPPSYAKPKRGKRFTIAEGYRRMAPHFIRVLRRGGLLLAMCNHAATDQRTFRGWLPRELMFEQWVLPPGDFGGADCSKIALLHRK